MERFRHIRFGSRTGRRRYPFSILVNGCRGAEVARLDWRQFLAADVVGYSRLMGRDESGKVAAQRHQALTKPATWTDHPAWRRLDQAT